MFTKKSKDIIRSMASIDKLSPPPDILMPAIPARLEYAPREEDSEFCFSDGASKALDEYIFGSDNEYTTEDTAKIVTKIIINIFLCHTA